MKKLLVWIGLSLLATILILIGGTVFFMNTSPQIGQRPEGADLERIRLSSHYGANGFVNITETNTGDIWEVLKTLPSMLWAKNTSPLHPLPAAFEDQSQAAIDSLTYITWYGHSAFMIELDGKRILIDPMLGHVAAPVSFGSKRFAYQNEIPIDQLDAIDVVLLSHDHYDHLDYPTILRLKDKVRHFITPLGVGSHLKAWGVAPENITELDWWEESRRDGIRYTACPARHFSGRGLTDRDATQWASWVLQSEAEKIYFSGDGGYGTHFAEIADKFGPFDFAMLECGQYNPAWSNIHMMPEETVQAGLDLKARLSMPIHWGAFSLAPHAWTEPITRFTKAADRQKLPYVLPTIGQRFALGQQFPKSLWWLQGV
ncbi:L-ascorbate metabolism protein UlaG (beta-lactamase superfamily) [Dyadobacter jejuensis]|uniref:L-ascorbate metabolism protein UlaG (Beta-lactamase superfamily) n=1 Tax=Dyadobacter jejuensis TaxID=1082580 RepID=A0A316AMJ2_9BACT|nr:MBL fold metallo-hydrolase [Dyadobacter jejuensis]PWJ58658.1 L-ascorbate metabolism protein UlaG (beta-lactamase superfamily) [Dyadobacter jejuensis]